MNNLLISENVYLITSIILIVVVCIIFIFAIIKITLNYFNFGKNKKNKYKKTMQIKDKNELFEILGGIENIVKIENKIEYLKVYCNDLALIKKEKLINYEVIKYEIKNNNEIDLYFKDANWEYDNLFK